MPSGLDLLQGPGTMQIVPTVVICPLVICPLELARHDIPFLVCSFFEDWLAWTSVLITPCWRRSLDSPFDPYLRTE